MKSYDFKNNLKWGYYDVFIDETLFYFLQRTRYSRHARRMYWMALGWLNRYLCLRPIRLKLLWTTNPIAVCILADVVWTLLRKHGGETIIIWQCFTWDYDDENWKYEENISFEEKMFSKEDFYCEYWRNTDRNHWNQRKRYSKQAWPECHIIYYLLT